MSLLAVILGLTSPYSREQHDFVVERTQSSVPAASVLAVSALRYSTI
jgi:hypothetical protein